MTKAPSEPEQASSVVTNVSPKYDEVSYEFAACNVAPTVEAVAAFYKERGRLTADELHMLVHAIAMQENGKQEFDRLMDVMHRGQWTIVDPFERKKRQRKRQAKEAKAQKIASAIVAHINTNKIARKQVVTVGFGDNRAAPIVTFTFDGSIVTSDYHDDSWRSHFESGIYSPKTGRVTPSDGAAFWEALDIEFVNSTHTDVIKLP